MKTEKYSYLMVDCMNSSRKYGVCEVCGEYVSEVYHQIEKKEYSGGHTEEGCKSYFGHKSCLESVQR